jgi:SAM-dependent methyltransferase
VYVCGHGASELERLEAQGALFEDITRAVFQAAGLGPGMHVLDVGCGSGDVTLLAAEMVGAAGSVLGVDRAPEAIAAARARAAARGAKNVEFRQVAIEELAFSRPLDALVGRFVLMHQANPAAALREAARDVRSGGTVAMIESDLSASVAGVHSRPPSPTYDLLLRFMVEALRGAGAHPDMGLRLGRTFLDAGLPEPRLWLQARVEGGTGGPIGGYMAESFRSMRPRARGPGLPELPTSDPEELERRIKEEVRAGGGVLTSPLVVAAWCRTAEPGSLTRPRDLPSE